MDILSENNGLTLLFGVCWMNPHEQYGDVLCLPSAVCHDGVRGYRRCALSTLHCIVLFPWNSTAVKWFRNCHRSLHPKIKKRCIAKGWNYNWRWTTPLKGQFTWNQTETLPLAFLNSRPYRVSVWASHSCNWMILCAVLTNHNESKSIVCSQKPWFLVLISFI